MNYPFWDVPLLGGGMLIGIIAIVHVFVAHFAVGGGLYLAWTERRARLQNDQMMLQTLQGHSRFFILVTLVFGAVTGAGIWWTIGLVSPSATSTLIHNFVWGWAIEWVFFFVEIVAAMIYYYGWDRLDAKTHQIVGWIYFGAAYASLLVINCILTFMLTPGKWIDEPTFWNGIYNPSMLPSLVVRTGVSIALAGMFALVTASALRDTDFRARLVKYAASWVLVGSVIIPLAGLWYIQSIPPLAREISMGGAPVVTMFASASVGISAFLVVATFFGAYLFPKSFNPTTAFVICTLGLMVTGVTEWVREAVRKPWVIYGYMYSNSILPSERSEIDSKGLLEIAKWTFVTPDDRLDPIVMGRKVFQFQCQSCHTVNGFNAIKPAVKGWTPEFMDSQIQRLNELKGYMPPFMGTVNERGALVAYLVSLNQHMEEAHGNGRP